MMRRPNRLFSPSYPLKILAPIFVCLFSMALTSSPAQAQPPVDFNPSAATVDCGQTVFVDVELDAAITDLRGFTFTFQFDPTYLTPVSVQPGALVSGAACTNFFSWVNQGSFVNTIQVDATLLGCSVDGPGSIIRIEFESGPQRGLSNLSMVSGILRDSTNASIAFTPPSGTVENLCNTNPVATDNTYATDEDTAVGGNVITDNTGAGVDDDIDGDGLTVNTTPVSGPSNGGLLLNSDGSFTYTPDTNWFGVDQFVYELEDGQGGTDQATVTITVNSVNDDPVAQDDEFATNEDTAVNGDVLADNNHGVDSDVDGDPLSVDPTPLVGPTNGGLSLNSNGTFTYTPNLNFNGTDTFQYTLLDGQGGSDIGLVTIEVLSVNDDPTASANTYTTDEDVAITTGNLITDDTGAGVDSDTDGGTLTISTTPATAPQHGALSLFSDGSFTYTPDLNYNGGDSFDYTLLDGQGGSDVATVSLTILPVNDPPAVTNPGDQTDTEYDVISLQIVASDVDLGDVLSYSATGLPSGLAIGASSGEISGQIDCGTAGAYVIAVTVSDGNGGSTDVNFNWTVDPLPAPAAISDLQAVQLTGLGANDTDGTTKIQLSWSGVNPSHTVKVYRKGWGAYPEYDDVIATAPSTPATEAAALGDGWIETGVTSSGQDDEVTARDFWYYVAFVFNECGTASAVSNQTGGTLNYHLGDVSDGANPPDGNNAVAVEDISFLGAHYGVSEGDALYVPELDIGPTTDLSVGARPTTDNEIQFEDLILFGINYGEVGKLAAGPTPSTRNLLTAYVGEPVEAQDEIEVGLWLEGDGRLQGLSVALEWDAKVVEPVEHLPGELLTAQNGRSLILSPAPGIVDATLFGVRKNGISGEGLLATVSFRRIADGEPAIGFGEVLGRSAENRSIELDTDVQAGSALRMEIPRVTALHPVYPNPFNPSTTVSFGLSREGRALIQIYAVNGRLVTTLVDEVLPAGNHKRIWDGTDAHGRQVSSGAYVARLIASDTAQTRRMVLLK